MSMADKEMANPEDGLRARYHAPPPISSQQVREYMEADIPSESNGFTSATKKNDLHTYPVPPLASGEGLPYAPINWPHPGDTWSWKVGRRVSKSGQYMDRYLFLPSHLQKTERSTQGFLSKHSVRQYIQEVDPEVDVAAFFGSFSWWVPAKREVPSPITPGVCSQSGKEVDQEEEKKTPCTFPRRKKKATKFPVTTMYRRRTRQSTKWIPRVNVEDIGIIDLCTLSEESGRSAPSNQDLRNSTDFECDRVCSYQALISPAGSFIAHSNSPVSYGIATQMKLNQERKDEVIPKNFETFIDSLDDMLVQPLSEGAFAPPASDNSEVSEDEFAEGQRKLSSILDMDFHVLVSSSKDLKELELLSCKLQKDPRLNADQLSKLKQIEEIPVIVKDFLHTCQIVNDVDKSLAELDSNRKMATSLKNEYNASKEDTEMLEADVLSSLSNLEELDDQIAKLQLRRAELSTIIKIKDKEVASLTASQGTIANSLPKFVHEVRYSILKKPEMEQKKKIALKQEAEILEKIAALSGTFSLKNAG